MNQGAREMMQRIADDLHQQFIDKIKIRTDDLTEIATGAIFSGRKALELKLVDELLGMDSILKQICNSGKTTVYYLNDPQTKSNNSPGFLKSLLINLLERHLK